MNFKPLIVLILILQGFYSTGFAQNSVTITPANLTIDDTLTILFNAAQGNKGLLDFTGEVYLHSGLITSASAKPNDWKYAIGNWGTDDKPALMKRISANTYEKKIVLSSYFKIPSTEEIKSIALVFRDVTGTKIAKSELNQDILVQLSMNPKVKASKRYLKNYVGYERVGNALLIKSDTAVIKIQAYSNSIVKLAYFQNGKIVSDTSYSVILKPFEEFPFTLDDSGEFLDCSTPQYTIHIIKSPLRISFTKMPAQSSGGNFLSNNEQLPVISDENGFFSENNSKGIRFVLNKNEAIYGTGSRATDLNKRGQKFSSYNTASYGYKIGAPTLNVNIPFIVSTEKYGIYFENHSAGYFDIGATEKNILEYKVEQGNLSYYLIFGNSLSELLNQYTSLTGRQPLPPRWSLGFIQSKYGYKTDEEALDIVKKLKAEKFPLDGLVLDLYWFGSPQTMGNLDWDTKKFKNPKKLIRKLNDEGVNLIPITETYIAKTSSNYDYLDKNSLLTKNKEGKSYVIENFWAGPSGLLDIYKPEAREWMWKKYKKQIDSGITGWWCDLGEPESHPDDMVHTLGKARYVHNVYSQFWAQLLSEKYKLEYPEKRLFNLIRSGYAGMQRYSTFPWSGDIQRSYAGLRTQIQIMLSMGMSGVAYTHSDLGGFTGGPKDPELYTRWLQFGAFCPIMRAHGEGVPPEPVFYDEKYKNCVRDYVNLRYKLLPYNYSLSYENTLSGIPIARPINFYEPENSNLTNVCDEYLWGENILVAPVLDSSASSRRVIFPEGKWYSFWADSVYYGGSKPTVYAPLEKMPIFVKEGSIIPTTALFSSTKYYKTDSLLVSIYPGIAEKTYSFDMFDDDGTSANSIENKQYQVLHFSSLLTQGSLNLGIAMNSDEKFKGAPLSRCITFKVKIQKKAPAAIKFKSGEKLPLLSAQEFIRCSKGACYNQSENALLIRCSFDGTVQSIQITY